MKIQEEVKSIRLVVRPRFKKLVEEKAESLGINVSTYIKHLIISDIQYLPVYNPSDKVRKNLKKSIKEKGILIYPGQVDNILDNI